MNASTLVNILIGLAILVWIGYRQLNWTAVAPDRMLRLPAILAIIGVGLLVQNASGIQVSGTDLAVLGVEAVISGAIGAVMGLLAHFRPMSPAAVTAYLARDSGRRRPGIPPTLETRNGWFGMALWLVLIAVRIGGEVWAHETHSQLLMSTGVILLTVALNRLVRIAVILNRATHVAPVASTVATGTGAAA
ncbi:hypothetical protein ACFPJ4_10935 [Lysinimonas soli]|uniref:DUF1453 domain-containing protein n=1 Tax=Lysinimonas soli TaxID=1074233 RepID=A0ABW0NSL9_9MICO